MITAARVKWTLFCLWLGYLIIVGHKAFVQIHDYLPTNATYGG